MLVLISLILILSGTAIAEDSDSLICVCNRTEEYLPEPTACCDHPNRICYTTFMQVPVLSNGLIAICRRWFQLNENIELEDIHNLVITGLSNGTTIHCSSDEYNGFLLKKAQNIQIRSVHISNCGALYNIASVENTSEVRINSQLMGSMYIVNSFNVTIHSVSIVSGNGKGLVMINSYGRVDNCTFMNNENQSRNSHAEIAYGGGLYIELDSVMDYEDTANFTQKSLTVENCTFVNNEALFQGTRTESYVHCNYNTKLQSFIRGGDIAIFLRGEVKNVTVTITDVEIKGNKAVWGGGMYIHFCNQVHHNQVELQNVHFSENVCEVYGGGGIDVGYTFSYHSTKSVSNVIEFNNCLFDGNSALFGGGVAMYFKETENSLNDSVSFINCTWIANTARYGAAIDIAPQLVKTPLHGNVPRVTLRDSTFKNNIVEISTISHFMETSQRAIEMNRQGSGRGTFLVIGVTIYFEGNAYFAENSGSAIYAISTILDFANGAKAIFTNNTGFEGGAIALIGFSAIWVSSNVSMDLLYNKADAVGGGLYHHSIDKHDYLFSHSCFIHKKDKNDDGIVFTFKGNKAANLDASTAIPNYGNSMFLTTLFPCNEYCRLFNETDKPLKCIGKFLYDDDDTIATSGAYFLPNITEPFIFVPGKKTKIPFELFDDLYQEVRGIYKITGDKSIFIDDINTYISENNLIIGGKPNSTGNLTITKVGIREVSFTINVTLDECPPFFIYNEERKICECAVTTKAAFQNIHLCHDSSSIFTSYVLHGYWVGYIGGFKSDSFRYGYCPLMYCFNGKERDRHHQLPGNKDVEMKVCGEKRSGVLCGNCRENFCAHYHSNTFKCGECTSCKYGFLLYAVSEVIPLTLLFMVVVIFNISFTSGLLNGFIFYAQVFDSIFSIGRSFIFYPYPVYILSRISLVIYKLFNFDFFGDDRLSFCLWKGATTIHMIAFKFVTVAIAGLLVLTTVLVMKRCAYSKSLCHIEAPSMIHGLSAFLVMVYTQCTQLSFHLLQYSQVSTLNGSTTAVLFYQGNINAFSTHHIPYAAIALLCLSTLSLVPPLYLISYPLCYKVSAFLRLDNSKFSKVLSKLFPFAKMKPVFDSFQGSFKDKYRHFAGLYFAYRVGLLASVLTNDPILTYTLTQIQLILMLAIHCLCWPYINHLHNIIDTLLLQNLTIINAITIFNYNYAQVGSIYQDTINISTSIQIIFVYAPIIYFVGVIVYGILNLVKPKKLSNSSPHGEDEIILERLDSSTEPKEHSISYANFSSTY